MSRAAYIRAETVLRQPVIATLFLGNNDNSSLTFRTVRDGEEVSIRDIFNVKKIMRYVEAVKRIHKRKSTCTECAGGGVSPVHRSVGR